MEPVEDHIDDPVIVENVRRDGGIESVKEQDQVQEILQPFVKKSSDGINKFKEVSLYKLASRDHDILILKVRTMKQEGINWMKRFSTDIESLMKQFKN